MAKKNTFESPIYITKRTAVPMRLQIIVRVIAIIIALIVCAVVTKVLTSDDPLSIFSTMLHGAVGEGRLLVTIHDIAILLCISLAVTPAFKMRFWNTGAEGQVLIGCLSTAVVMLTLGGKVADWLLIIIMAAAAILSGIIWGVVPAFFKAQWGTNETLFTLMMNYVAIQLVEYFLKIADKSGSNVVGPDLLTHGWFPDIFGVKYLLNILIVATITILMHIYLKYSKQGYEIAVVGESENTARYIGINVKKVILRTMAVSGAVCGIAGLLLVGGSSHSVDANLVSGRGFTAIMVSWLAKFKPVTMILTTLLIVFLERGADEVSSRFGLNSDFADILTGIILFFIIGCEFFINYKINYRKKNTQTKETEAK